MMLSSRYPISHRSFSASSLLRRKRITCSPGWSLWSRCACLAIPDGYRSQSCPWSECHSCQHTTKPDHRGCTSKPNTTPYTISLSLELQPQVMQSPLLTTEDLPVLTAGLIHQPILKRAPATQVSSTFLAVTTALSSLPEKWMIMYPKAILPRTTQRPMARSNIAKSLFIGG